MIELGANRYGKAAIRLVRVVRGPAGDRLRDLTVAIALEGDFEAAHTDGDNALVIATDTMKNTAYAFAKDHLDGSIEDYGRALAEHFLECAAGGRGDASTSGRTSGPRSTSRARPRPAPSSAAARGRASRRSPRPAPGRPSRPGSRTWS